MFDRVLEMLDSFNGSEELEELNAQFEDILFWLDSADDDEKEEVREETFDDLSELLQEYRELEGSLPEIGKAVDAFAEALLKARNA